MPDGTLDSIEDVINWCRKEHVVVTFRHYGVSAQLADHPEIFALGSDMQEAIAGLRKKISPDGSTPKKKGKRNSRRKEG
jgi:hypothetical protein